MEIPVTNIPLFKGCALAEVEDLLSSVVFQRKKFTAGSLIVSQGEVCDRLLILTEGKVVGEMTSPTGKSLKIEEMEAPMVLASAFLFGKQNKFPVSVTALTHASFMVFQRNDLMKMFRLNPRVLSNFLSMISSRAQFLSEKLRFHSFKSLKAKVAFYLTGEAGTQKKFKLKHSQEEMAELFGVARPSVGRIFLQLQNENIIDIRYKNVTIKNFDKLAELCNH